MWDRLWRMRIVDTGPGEGRAIEGHGSRGAHQVRLLLQERQNGSAVTLIHLSPGALLGAHPAGWPQLLIVVSGQGWVRAGDELRRPIAAGAAAYFERDEVHESGTESGMTVIVIESPAAHEASVHGQMLAGGREAGG